MEKQLIVRVGPDENYTFSGKGLEMETSDTTGQIIVVRRDEISECPVVIGIFPPNSIATFVEKDIQNNTVKR